MCDLSQTTGISFHAYPTCRSDKFKARVLYHVQSNSEVEQFQTHYIVSCDSALQTFIVKVQCVLVAGRRTSVGDAIH